MTFIFIVVGSVALFIAVLLWLGTRQQSKEHELEEVAVKLRQHPKFKEANLVVDILYSARISGVAPGFGGMPEYYTRLRVIHKGKAPCIIRAKRPGVLDIGSHKIGMLSFYFMDVEIFEAAQKQGLQELDWPGKVHDGNKKISTAIDKQTLPQYIKFTESIFDTVIQEIIAGIPFVTLRIERKAITLISESVLREHNIRRGADLLLLLSDRVQRATNSLD